jgi:hypothetical protein
MAAFRERTSELYQNFQNQMTEFQTLETSDLVSRFGELMTDIQTKMDSIEQDPENSNDQVLTSLCWILSSHSELLREALDDPHLSPIVKAIQPIPTSYAGYMKVYLMQTFPEKFKPITITSS